VVGPGNRQSPDVGPQPDGVLGELTVEAFVEHSMSTAVEL
jgi:hypothetical protein